MATLEQTKELIADPKKKIELDDFVSGQIKEVLAATDQAHFPVQGSNVTSSEFLDRVKRYEQAIREIRRTAILLARWGDPENILQLEKIFARIGESDKGSAGITLWLNMGWYPIQSLMYAAGIAALVGKKFDALKVCLTTMVPFKDGKYPLVIAAIPSMANIGDGWKWIPDHENKHTPRSEYLMESLLPSLEEVMLLGGGYEDLFDEFEIYLALTYAEVSGREWAPVGRFGWKRSRGYRDPYKTFVEDALRQKNNWPPLRIGMFGGSIEGFEKIAKNFETRLEQMHWF